MNCFQIELTFDKIYLHCSLEILFQAIFDRSRNSNINHPQLAFSVRSSGTLICFDLICCRPNTKFTSSLSLLKEDFQYLGKRKKKKEKYMITFTFIWYLGEFRSFAFLFNCHAVCFYHTDFPSFLPAASEQENTEGNRQICGNPPSHL